MIRAFSVCVDYSDLLKLTYPFNKQFFDSYTIVTSNIDTKTIQYCTDNNIDLICSTKYKSNNAKFNKAAMLNLAIGSLEATYPNDWLLSLDVDIIIDSKKIDIDKLNKDFMYGSRRKIITNESLFNSESSLDVLQNPDIGYIQDIGHWPYAQVGYFQLFYKKKCRFNEKYLTASDCDTDFFYDHFKKDETETFNTNKLMCYHLGDIEKNWAGRITNEWGK